MKKLLAITMMGLIGALVTQSAFANPNLEAIMKDLAKSAMALNKQLNATSADLKDLSNVQQLEKLAVEAQAEYPDDISAMTVAEDKRLSEISYQLFLVSLHSELLQVEKAMLNDNLTDAKTHLAEVWKIQKAGHQAHK